MTTRQTIGGLGVALLLAWGNTALAQDKAAPPAKAPAPAANPAPAAAKPAQASREEEGDQAFAAALKASKPGPVDVPLLEQAAIKLPNGYLFVPRAEGDRLMRAFGNRTGPNFLGLIMPAENASWFATIDYQNAGYVRDDDAKTWKADELLQTLKDGTESGNEDRAQRGFPPIEVAGWVEPPAYSAATHRLVWAAKVRRKGETQGGSVNYNTYALGRDGYFELNMIGSAEVIEKERGRAQELLAALNYVPGKAYGDFNAGTDRVAEYGLAALIAGVAAKKLGMFALVALALAKGGKLLIVAGLALVALVGKMFGGLFGRKPPAPPEA